MNKVLILIPAFNAEATLAKTLESLFKQTHQNFEILVVDNDSSDGTHKVVESFNDIRLSYFKNEKNLGNYGNFDRCIGLAKYDYTAIFHADDIYLPTILEEQVRILASFPEVGAVFTEALRINNELEEIGIIKTPLWVRLRSRNGFIKFTFPKLLKAIIHNNCFLMTPSAIVRSKIYTDEIKRTRTEDFGMAADVDVWLRIAQNWNVVVITKALMKYRISNSQHTFKINQKRIERGEYALLANYYRKSFGAILRKSNVAIKREKTIDLIIRLDSIEKGSHRYKQYRNLILKSILDIRLFRNLRWWKYFLKFLEIQFK